MYKIILECVSVPEHFGPQAAIDITEEFTHRPWHLNVHCTWDENRLMLQAENDFDPDGLALLDEFSDAIAACVERYDSVGPIRVVEVSTQ